MADVVMLEVRIQPRAGRDEIAGEREGRILVRVSAPPVDGRANEALCRLVAKRVGLSRRAVTLARGERSRDKLLRIEGLDPQALRERLGLPAAS